MEPEVDSKKRIWNPKQGAPIAVLTGLLVLCAGQMQGQNDSSGLSQQSPAPVTITPAPNNPAGNTPAAPIFPQATTPQSSAGLVTRPPANAAHRPPENPGKPA